MTKALSIANALMVGATIAWNYTAGTSGINGNTVSSLSREYDTLFTPASYAFSIWGVIFIGLVANAAYLLRAAFKSASSDKSPTEESRTDESRQTIRKMVPPLLVANAANCLWVWLWLSEHTGASVVTILVLLAALATAVWRLDMAKWDAPLRTIAWIWWPVAIYVGWVTVAAIANLTAYMQKVGWLDGIELPWTLAMIALATVINVVVVIRRNLREFACVGIWALVAIAQRQRAVEELVANAATAGAAVLVVLCCAHAYQNRKTLPFVGKPGSTAAPTAANGR